MKTTVLAGIDIGSNAVRLLINNIEGKKARPDFKKVAFLRVPIRLGEDVFSEGKISDEKKNLLISAMKGFTHIMEAYKVSAFRACATSAMRDALNGQAIVDLIREECDICVDILSGRGEADIIYEAGRQSNLVHKAQNYLAVDVGGGSTEMTLYNTRGEVISRSFQMGTIRMLMDIVKKEDVDEFKLWLKTIYKDHAPLDVIASGGNINKVHKMLEKRESECLSYTELKVLYDVLKEQSYKERIRNYKLNTYRADVIIPALKIFLTIGKICKVNRICVPKIGLADGIIRRLYMEVNRNT